jgi:hypothetical protein
MEVCYDFLMPTDNQILGLFFAVILLGVIYLYTWRKW